MKELAGLRDLDLKLGYDTVDEALRDFYVPALSRAISYDRSVGYFRASAFAVAARGLSRFIAGGGTARFLVGAEIEEGDEEALLGATEIPPELARRLAQSLVPTDEVARRRLEVLAWLIKERRLEIRVAVALDDEGVPVAPGVRIPYFHEKIGLLRDHRQDGVAFQGSVNESITGWVSNFESFSVYRSWDASAAYFDVWADKFDERWAGHVRGFRVFPLPEAVAAELVSRAPAEPPPARDVEEAEVRADRRTLARFLLAAPRLVGSEALAQATSGVTLFPHQRKVEERLAGQYPRSWLVADEVGLGKTISAGVALRRLLMTGEVQRVLILAPANVCRQWQDELFEKFGLWVPRYESGRLFGAHPDDIRMLPTGVNPYDEERVLLVSSHLARRPSHRVQILAATRYDLLIVDEAHHARRRGSDLHEYRPSRLLQLLDDVRRADHARAVWLLTATPMQVHAVELLDLLRQVGLSGALEHFANFARYHAELGRGEGETTDWRFVARVLADTPTLPFDAADQAILNGIATELGPVQRQRIERFGRPGEDSASLVEGLNAAGRLALRRWLRQRGPLGQLVTRHTRETLRRYRRAGLLRDPVAERSVKAVPVPFTPQEERLYGELDALLDRLMAAHGTRRGAGFVLTIYRRRLTSSWEAIRRTLSRRLDKERRPLELGFDLLDEADDEELDTGEGGTVDDTEIVPLTKSDLKEIDDYLVELKQVPDSKFDQLRDDLDDLRGRGRSVIVFTQFTDTLEYLKRRLHPSYRSHLASYSGSGGQQWLEGEGWTRVSKQDLVEALRSGRVSVLLATDAASEGLNLQAANALINYDLPWNPMRVEQRIGRIDRIGQPTPVIIVRNYVIPGTVEESVYGALAARIDLFSGLVGQLQPILGATEEAFRSIFRSPRSERAQAKEKEIAQLLAHVDELERSGLDLGDDDPMPEPPVSASPVTLAELASCLSDDLDISLDRSGRSTTNEPTRASRDPERWMALATYGHPDLAPALGRFAGALLDDGTEALVLRELQGRWIAYRADHIPPERVRTLADLTDLGPSVAGQEADAQARQELAEAVHRSARYKQEVIQARRERWEADVRRRFRRLVTQAVNAESVLRLRRDEEPPEARLIWLELGQDEHSPWHYGDLFRQHLRVELTDLLSASSTGADSRSDRELARVREETGAVLLKLMEEWRSVVYPDGE